MDNTEKFLMLFADFDMTVVEKSSGVEYKHKKDTTEKINANQKKGDLERAHKRLSAEYNKARKSFKNNKISRQELFDFEWRLFEIREEINRLDDEETTP